MLKAQGETFEAGKKEATSSHRPKRQQDTFADHGSKEMPEPTRKAIIKQQGL